MGQAVGRLIMKAMILAAGFGKRMLPLTATTPKPLLQVGGKALIEYPINKLAVLGVNDIVINHAYLGQRIVDYLGNGEALGVQITYSAETEPLETAGGISKALPLLGSEPFILVNGDIWSDFDFNVLTTSGRKLSTACLGHLILVPNPEHNTEGDFSIDVNGRLIESDGVKSYTYSGMAVLTAALFERYGVSSGPLAPLLRLALADGLLTAEVHTGLWFDVGTPERLASVDQLVRSL